MDEEPTTFRKFIAGGQWTSSWAIVVLMLGTLLGLKAELNFESLIGWPIVSIVAGFLVVSMAISWRIPGWPRGIAIVVEIFILICGVSLAHYRLETSKMDAVEENLRKLRESIVYRSIQVELDAATKNFQILSATHFDQDHHTAQARNEVPKNEAAKHASDLRKKLVDLEDEAKRAPVVSASTAFSVFGKEWAFWIEFLALLFFAAGNEGLALALTHPKYSRTAVPPQSFSPVTDASPAMPTHVHPTGDQPDAVDEGSQARPAPLASTSTLGATKSIPVNSVEQSADVSSSKSTVTFEDYKRAFDVLVSDGQPHGYRVIMRTLGISEPRARKYASMVKKDHAARKDQST